ncbi:nose resistant to fluoxetine protein 6-like [Elysia marginata]|uniref:Nose resistant to fluoxetine protein 6-like n=1 Tax=Elysia marginata TaxID=1093978 RepID=A0AAV4FLK5_9GAST|nr:nose resistant to fluoxetine protein 6-like [Elysia marginata]
MYIKQEVVFAFLRLDILKTVRRILSRKSASTWFPQGSGVSGVCYSHLMTYFEGLIGRHMNNSNSGTKTDSLVTEDWALRMLDAMGKPSSGLLVGRLQLIGDYDQCVKVTATESEATTIVTPDAKGDHPSRQQLELFRGRYCRVRMPMAQYIDRRLPENVNTFWLDEDHLPININWGVCVPNTCSARDITAFLTQGTFNVLGLPIEDVLCFEDTNLADDPGAVFVILLLSLFGVCVAFCTGVDLYMTIRDSNPSQTSPCWCLSQDSALGSANSRVTPTLAGQHRQDQATEGVPSPLHQADGLGTNPDILKETAIFTDAGVSTSQEAPKHVSISVCKPDTMASSAQEHSKPSTENTLIEIPLEKNETQQLKGGHIIKGTSLYTNFVELMNTDVSRSKPTIRCLEGLKAITMAWVVLGHTYTFGGIIDENNIVYDNALEMTNIPDRLAFHIGVGSAQFGVDTFFVICGCLVMFISLDKLKHATTKWQFWTCFIFRRFWRLTPIYMVVLAIGTNLYDHIVSGPLKAENLEEFHECRDKWWAHLLYINNFYRPTQKVRVKLDTTNLAVSAVR